MGLAFPVTICDSAFMAQELIASLGGPTAVASALGQKPNAVSNWINRGIPLRWRPAVAELARRRGVKVPADFIASSQATERAA